MTPLYRVLSIYAEFLLGLKQMRPRLLVFLAVLGVFCFVLAGREGAPIVPRVGLFITSVGCAIALLGAVAVQVLNYTLFQAGAGGGAPVGPESAGQGSAVSEPLNEGVGVPARVSGALQAGRHRQQFGGSSGGVLRQEGQLHVVVPTQAFQVIGGINAGNCYAWWRATLGDEVERVELGSLWSGGQALPALRFRRGRLGVITVGAADSASFARLISTVRSLEYPIQTGP